MGANLTVLADVACASLIIVYAWDRFNTPASNRSSTRQTLYWWSCIGYIVSALTLFVVLSLLLRVGPWRTALLGSADNSSLPAPLIATLAMTTLLSSVPALKQVDSWILSTFLNWAAIPAEVKRRVATMLPRSFSVSDVDVTALRDNYGDGTYGDTLARHLCARGGQGLADSQYRFTRVVKLYDQLKKLAGEPSYSRFFSEAADEIAAIESKMESFLRRSDSSLNLMERLRTVDAEAVGELLQERRELFAEGCRDMFRELALFTARAILRSEGSEADIVRRLRMIGFAASEPMNLPSFPIDSLTVLAFAMFIYLFLMSVFFAHVPSAPNTGGGLLMPCKITLARLISIGVTVWLMQNCCQLRRLPGRPLHYFGYLVCGVIASVASALVCLVFRLGDADPLSGLGPDLPVILLSGILCFAVALCCDDWVEDASPPPWLRYVEAAGCAAVMAVGAALVYAADLLPFELSPLMFAAWIALPSIMALMIGGWVPHIYRSARRTAKSERGEMDELPSNRPRAQENAPAVMSNAAPPLASQWAAAS
jgi:hypothetical protein